MTTPPGGALADLLAGTRHLLLDFDGPICTIFAGYPAREVVLELTDLVTTHGTTIPDPVAAARDPFDVLRYAATIDPELAQRVEARLAASEIEATRTAAPTPHAAEVISAWRDAHRSVAVISNNSAAAIETYLTEHEISVDLVTARASADPTLLKPNPYLIIEAIHELGAEPTSCVLVGDSTTDIAAAQHAGVPTIGYANKPGKRNSLTDAGADIVIDDMHALGQAVAIASS